MTFHARVIGDGDDQFVQRGFEARDGDAWSCDAVLRELRLRNAIWAAVHGAGGRAALVGRQEGQQ